MIVSDRCQRCGSRLPKGDVLGGGCPRCMLELGYETEFEADTAAATNSLPASIGRYRILRVIGEGGMGIVYEAEQEQPRRTVALKIIKRGIANAELLWRFEMETEALGRLQHPGIAQIYEAGTVDTGFGPQPYFAMELIRGIQPCEFAELHQLDTRQRVELMIRICEAVHHAHQRGLIHRDLKPANILVDEDGQPKILDFGVVRVTDSDTRSTTDTKIGQLIGTLPYMSPEQALADPLELDIRTDVYSLGIIFYELLTGRLPYTVSKKIHEAIQSIRDDDPARISALNRSYRGDIETIVGTALEKDKTRRYQSSFGLAIDLRRYLNDEPIAARPPSKNYQLRKFTRRNKTLVAGVAAVFFALVAGVVAFAWMANLRQTEVKNKDAVLKFVGKNIFGLPIRKTQLNLGRIYQGLPSPNPNITLKEALDSSVLKIHDLDDQPLTEATVLEYIADTYFELGQYREGTYQLEHALALRLREQGRTNPETLQTTARLAEAYVDLNQFLRAEELAKQVIGDARNTAGDVDPSVRSAVSTLVSMYSRTAEIGDQSRGFSKVERLLMVDVIDYQRRKFGAANPTVQFAIGELFSLYTKFKPQSYSDGAAFMKQISDDWRAALGEGSSAALKVEKQVICLYLIPQPQPRYTEAEEYLEKLVEDQRSALGDNNPATQNTINYLVSVYLEQGKLRYAEAESLLERVVDETRRKLGNDSLATRNASIALTKVYLKQNRNKEAAALLTPYATDSAVANEMAHPLALLEQVAVPDQPWPLSVHTYGGKPANLSDVMLRLTLLEQSTIVDVLDRLAQSYDKEGKTAEAQATAKKLKDIQEAMLNSTRNVGGWEFGRPLKSMGVMAIRYIEEGRKAEADAMLNTVMDGYRQVAGKSSNAPEIATLITSAALTYTGKGDNHRAEDLLTAIVKFDEGGASRNFTLSNSLSRLGNWYMDRDRYDDARRIEERLNEIRANSNRTGQFLTQGARFNSPQISDIGEFIPN